MKVGFFLDIPKGLGGAGNLLLKQAKLVSEQHEVVVIIPCDEKGASNSEYINRCVRYGIPYKVAEYKTAWNFRDVDLLGALKSASDIEALIKEEGIDFLHTVQLNVAAEFASRRMGIPHLMDIYQLEQEEFRLCFADFYSRYVLCDSEKYSGIWSTCLGAESWCIRPVAVLPEMKHKESYEFDTFHIVMLGAVCLRKNQLKAIQAVKEWNLQKKVRLSIAGDEDREYGKRCREYVRENGLEECVEFLGFVSDIVPLLLKSDAILCASTWESFPSSLVEALTYDLAIISTPVAGVPEIFHNQENAFISSAYDERSIGECIHACLEAYASRDIERIHRNAEKTWEKYFSQKIVRRQLSAVYQSIIDREKMLAVMPAIPVDAISEVQETFQKLLPFWNGHDGIVKKDLYYTFLKKKLEKGDAYLWGAGKCGKIALELIEILFPQINVKAFLDTNKSGQYCGKPIFLPDILQDIKVKYVFICFISQYEEAVAHLRKLGFSFNINCFLLP